MEHELRDMDPVFWPIYEKCKGYTLTSPERMYSLFKSIEYITKSKIPGCIIECGVWKGGSTMVILESLKHFGDTERYMYLFDTFEGMAPPEKEDADLDGVHALQHLPLEGWKENCAVSLEDVTQNVNLTGYPVDKIFYKKGMVEDTIDHGTFKNQCDHQIALLRLDTDWYSSTKHELENLYPILVKNGVLIIDDYGHWKGAKQATDEYFKEIPILLNRIDYTGRIGIKIE